MVEICSIPDPFGACIPFLAAHNTVHCCDTHTSTCAEIRSAILCLCCMVLARFNAHLVCKQEGISSFPASSCRPRGASIGGAGPGDIGGCHPCGCGGTPGAAANAHSKQRQQALGPPFTARVPARCRHLRALAFRHTCQGCSGALPVSQLFSLSRSCCPAP